MKALIFDLDDTLLNAHKRVDTRTQKALLAGEAAGFALVLSTSRPIRAVRHFLDADFLARFTLVTLNGSHVFRGSRLDCPRILARLGPLASALLADIEACDPLAHITIELDGWQFASNRKDDPQALMNYQLATPDMVLPMEAVDLKKASKIAVDGGERRLESCLALAGIYRDFCFVPALGGRFLSILPKGIDKASTLRLLAREGAFDLESSYAFGDDEPDLPMLAAVGHPVAMGNACASVQAAAEVQIGDCNQEAIGIFLEDLLRRERGHH